MELKELKSFILDKNLEVLLNNNQKRVLESVKFDSDQPFNGLYFRVKGEDQKNINKMIIDSQQDKDSIYLYKDGKKVGQFTPTKDSKVVYVTKITEITGNELVLSKYWDFLIEDICQLLPHEYKYLKDICWKEPLYKEFLGTFNL